jgi:hypothetical protein
MRRYKTVKLRHIAKPQQVTEDYVLRYIRNVLACHRFRKKQRQQQQQQAAV